jgi:hypothetical protein
MEEESIIKIRGQLDPNLFQTALHFSFKRQSQLNKTLKHHVLETDISFSEQITITSSLRDVSTDKRYTRVNGMPVATLYAVFIIFPISPDMFSCYGEGEFWINF